MSAFVPRPFENGAYMELLADREREEIAYGTNSSSWSDTFLREKLTLYSDGYFYHPRFIQYRFSITGALKQEEYSMSELGSFGWKTGTGFEYQMRLYFLPEHPYNLEAYAERLEPVYKEQSATLHDSVQFNRGVLFQYRRKPWFFDARYALERNEASDLTSNVRTYGANGEFVTHSKSGNYLLLNAGITPRHFENTNGLDGDSRNYHLGSTVGLEWVHLEMALTGSSLDQVSPASGRYKSDSVAWTELLTAKLPWNLRGNAIYRYLDNENTYEIPGASGGRTLASTIRDLEFDLMHRLYQSLDTTYVLRRNDRVSSVGDSTTTSQSLGFNYNKMIPRGRVMTGIGLNRSDNDNRGQTEIVDEPHPQVYVPVLPGGFRLAQKNVDRASIRVFLQPNDEPFKRIPLDEYTHYTLTAVAGTYDVMVYGLPLPYTVPGTYNFYVSYALTTGTFVYRLDTYSYSASVELLDALLTPYGSYIDVRSDILSGAFPGTPLDSITRAAGLLVRSGPWRGRGEYQDTNWEASPYRAWRFEIEYVGEVDPRTSLYASTTYEDRYYSQGASIDSPEPWGDRTLSTTGNVQHEVSSQNLTLSAGFSYSRSLGQVESNSYSLNGSAVWRIGKLDLEAGANASMSDVSGGTVSLNSRNHQYYYFKLRRQLF